MEPDSEYPTSLSKEREVSAKLAGRMIRLKQVQQQGAGFASSGLVEDDEETIILDDFQRNEKDFLPSDVGAQVSDTLISNARRCILKLKGRQVKIGGLGPFGGTSGDLKVYAKNPLFQQNNLRAPENQFVTVNGYAMSSKDQLLVNGDIITINLGVDPIIYRFELK